MSFNELAVRVRRIRVALVLKSATLLVVCSTATAHHAIAPHFDVNTSFVLDALVTDMRIVNPHAYLFFEVTTEDGSVEEWRCEMWSGTGLRRRGWTEDTIPVGMRAEIDASPAWREDHHCMLNSATFENGLVVSSQSVLGESTLATANEQADPLLDPPAQINGRPNFSGYWVKTAFPGVPLTEAGSPIFGGPVGPGFIRPPGGRRGGELPDLQLTDQGSAAIEGYEFVYDNPAVHCHPTNILFGLTHDSYVNRFEQNGAELALRYGYMDFERLIPLDGSSSGQGGTTAGASHAKWDGDVLVVTTTAFSPGYLIADSNGNTVPHGSNLTVTERFSLSQDRQTMIRDYEAVDPDYFSGTYRGQDSLSRTREPYSEYNCVELGGANNTRPSP